MLPIASQAQFRTHDAGPERLSQHALESIDAVFAWYDGPVFALYILNKYDVIPDHAKPIVITATETEQALARQVAVQGSSSAGSMDPFRIPNMILAARSIHAVGMELFDDDADTRNEMRGILGLYKTLMYTEILTQGVKSTVYRVRPNESDTRSFFSGHTSTTFAMSSYLERELDDALIAWSVLDNSPTLRDALRMGKFTALYGWAAYVGYSRMRDNKHYLADVLVGALVGTLLGNLVYDSVAGIDRSFLPDVGVISTENGPQLSLHMEF